MDCRKFLQTTILTYYILLACTCKTKNNNNNSIILFIIIYIKKYTLEKEKEGYRKPGKNIGLKMPGI